MAITALKYTTPAGSKMNMGRAPYTLGIEMLFISCSFDERKKLLADLAEKHTELTEEETPSPLDGESIGRQAKPGECGSGSCQCLA